MYTRRVKWSFTHILTVDSSRKKETAYMYTRRVKWSFTHSDSSLSPKKETVFTNPSLTHPFSTLLIQQLKGEKKMVFLFNTFYLNHKERLYIRYIPYT